MAAKQVAEDAKPIATAKAVTNTREVRRIVQLIFPSRTATVNATWTASRSQSPDGCKHCERDIFHYTVPQVQPVPQLQVSPH